MIAGSLALLEEPAEETLSDDRALALAQRHEEGDLDAALAEAATLYCELENPAELVGGDNS